MPESTNCNCCKGVGECSTLDDDDNGNPVIVTGKCRACSGTGKTPKLSDDLKSHGKVVLDEQRTVKYNL